MYIFCEIKTKTTGNVSMRTDSNRDYVIVPSVNYKLQSYQCKKCYFVTISMKSFMFEMKSRK